MKCAFTLAAVLWLGGLLVGCQVRLFSEQSAKAISDVIERGAKKVVTEIRIARDVGIAVEAFRRKSGRWPSTYPELQEFVAGSNGYLTLSTFDEIRFQTRDDGAVDVTATKQGATSRVTVHVPAVEAQTEAAR